MGSSPARMPNQNGIGSGPATSGITGWIHFSIRGMPGTSVPMWFTISWNIMVWLHSSTASCKQYRYSGEPLGTQNAYSIKPRIRMDSKCRPTLARSPDATCRSGPDALQTAPGTRGCRPSGSVAGNFQRGSLSVTANSGDFQSMSVYGFEIAPHRPLGQCGEHLHVLHVVWTSMLRRQRRTIFVRAVFWPISSLLMRFTFGTRYVQHSTAGIANFLDPCARCGPSRERPFYCGVAHILGRGIGRCGSRADRSLT